jgi:hypothetical protein
MIARVVVVHPVAEAELNTLPADMQARFLRIAKLLENFGPSPPIAA